MSFSVCGSIGANTGAVKCDKRRGVPKKIIIGSASFAKADYATTATFDAAFLAKFKLANGNAQKLYPFPEITGVSDKTEAPKEGTLGAFGPKVTLMDGKPGYEVDVVAGVAQEKKLRKFNGQSVPAFIVDDSGTIWGKIDSNGNITGTEVFIYTTPHKFGDAANGQTTKVSISFVSSSDIYDSAVAINTDLGVSDMEGLLDAQLREVIAAASNVITVSAFIETTTAGGEINLYDSLADALADATIFKATVLSSGADLAISSAAKDATNKGIALTADSAAFTALPSEAKIKIETVDPAVLDAKNITGVEILPVIVTKA